MSSRKCRPISTHSTPLNATLPPPLPHQAQASPFKNLTDRKRVVLVYTFGRIKYFSYLEPYTKTIRCFDPSHIWLAVFFLFKYLVYVYTPMAARRGRSSLWTRVTGCWDCLTWVLGTTLILWRGSKRWELRICEPPLLTHSDFFFYELSAYALCSCY